MPMQPRPMAEAVGPVEPSLRFSMVVLLEWRRAFRALMTALLWSLLIAAISWTILNSLFTMANNERSRFARSRRLCGGGPHPGFPPRGDPATRVGLAPQPAGAPRGGAALSGRAHISSLGP